MKETCPHSSLLSQTTSSRRTNSVFAIGSPGRPGRIPSPWALVSARRPRSPDPDKPLTYIPDRRPQSNPGNSGGTLVDMNGSVVGINTSSSRPGGGSEGLGFAIPPASFDFVYHRPAQIGHVSSRSKSAGRIAQAESPPPSPTACISRNAGRHHCRRQTRRPRRHRPVCGFQDYRFSPPMIAVLKPSPLFPQRFIFTGSTNY